MLLVTLHGGSGGETNVLAFDTSTRELLTDSLLSTPPQGSLDELRSLVLANGYLYVANGGTSSSSVLCYSLAASGASAAYVSTLLACSLSNGQDFTTAIAHPFGLAFDGTTTAFVSNQDTNVVARAALSSGGTAATLGNGSQSAYLAGLFPPPATFLDGTFVASQTGKLHHVTVVAPDVPASDGGLAVTLDPNKKVQNSVRDVALAGGLLFVCDESGKRITMYASQDGAYLGSSTGLGEAPTHLAIFNGGLLVSAKSALYWSTLPAGGAAPTLTFQQVALAPPGGTTIGGLSFSGTDAVTAYVVIQGGTGGADGGAIYTYDVTQANAASVPVFSNQAVFVESGSGVFTDTPEFVLAV